MNRENRISVWILRLRGIGGQEELGSTTSGAVVATAIAVKMASPPGALTLIKLVSRCCTIIIRGIAPAASIGSIGGIRPMLRQLATRDSLR
tara:strand:+ start:1032 stop:1304 length:273 start_codon:yes stop_codon:yes gene_type:complete